ncbi:MULTISPECIES: GIY-YIG nuclease family protein [unclassified Thioalkalivibrio]|uniref:GIY-YIG nuclease family protein n=1 Tax=unclassified Thioalkalivibrio TaxID=2621013 RepID=UPI0003755704|nr:MULTISPECIES: GIY-YIG nuclease family protein [unclassified Thioalkalivibrio]
MASQGREPWEKHPAVYILTNRREGTLYTGVTSNLPSRIAQHRDDLVPGFTRRYKLHRLVWFEQQDSMDEAIRREKQIKRWRRRWKIDLVETENPTWRDLYDNLF